jgi:hypothetical protein
MAAELARLQAKRVRLYQALSETDDFRRGSLGATYRRCGKPNCACAKPGHPGHGPRYLLTTKVEGKTCAREVPPGPGLERVKAEVANHQKFRGLVREIVEVNEQICNLKAAELPAADAAQKGASKAR